MKSVLVVVLIGASFGALLGACSFRHTTVEQPAPASAAVVVPDNPPPATSTTVVTTPD